MMYDRLAAAAAFALTLALGGGARAEDAYPVFPTARPVPVVSGEALLLPANGDLAPQTANSLPRGAMEGTVAYAQAQVAARYFAERAGRTQLAAQRPAGVQGG